jgi:hypothetical protein
MMGQAFADLYATSTTTRKLAGRLQYEIAEAALRQRNLPFKRVTTILREHLTANPARVWIDVHYDSPLDEKRVATFTLEEWCAI